MDAMKGIGASILCALFVVGCSHPQGEQQAPSDPSVLTLADTEAALHLHTITPESGPLFDELDLSGRIDFDPDMVSKVYPPVNGIVSRVLVNPGNRVHRGEVLAEVTSGDYAGAVSDVRKAEAQVAVAAKAMARAHDLVDAKLLSVREYQQAISDSLQASAELERATRVLKAIDGSPAAATAGYLLRAPIDGIVLERNAQIGSQVKNDNSLNLFTIGKTRSVWVLLDLYQDQFARIATGDSVVVTVDGTADSVYPARIQFVSPVLDPTTMTGKARCTLDNSSGLFRPAMFCSARVFHPVGRGLLVPATAAFYDGNGRTYVFVKTARNTFQKREIKIGRVTREKLESLAGLNRSDIVVADRGIFLNEELQLSQH